MIQIIRPSTLKVTPKPDLGPYLTFYRSGRIRLSASLSRQMEVGPGSHVVFISWEGHHYVAASATDDGFPLSGGPHPHLQNRDLYADLCRRLDLAPIKRIKLDVARAPQYINGFYAYQILREP